MSIYLSSEEKEERLAAKNKLARATVLILIEDKFLSLYVRRIFREILEIQNTVECTTISEAKKYLDARAGKNLSCVISSMRFVDGSTGEEFLRFARSTYRSVVAPFILIGDNTDASVHYAFLVKHFAGHISQPFTPSEFVHMLLEVFMVRDRRREQRELANSEKNSRPFNRLYEGDSNGS